MDIKEPNRFPLYSTKTNIGFFETAAQLALKINFQIKQSRTRIPMAISRLFGNGSLSLTISLYLNISLPFLGSAFVARLTYTFFFIRDTFIRDSAWIFVRN